MKLQTQIKELVLYRNNSIPELAKEAGVSVSTMNRVLYGQVAEGTLLKIRKNLKVLDTM